MRKHCKSKLNDHSKNDKYIYIYIDGLKFNGTYFARFSDPARGIDPGRGEGQRVRGSTWLNRGSTGQIDPVYIQNKKYIFSYI